MSIISLLSDFGIKDAYVAEMKAIIITINPLVRLIDITHEIDKFSIRKGAYILASAAPYFPLKTTHLAVVDPGVGTKRRPLIVETKRGLYVGPDNGLLMLAAHKDDIINVYVIENPNYMLPKVSKTFHGRDIFAPAAAYLTKGVSPSMFGPEIHDYVFPNFAKSYIENGELVGEILHLDDFGNVISNISGEDLKQAGFYERGSFNVTINGKNFNLQFCLAYCNVPISAPLSLIGSSNFLEFAVNQGSGSKFFNAKVGDLISVSRNFST